MSSRELQMNTINNSTAILAQIPEDERAKELKDLDLDQDSLPIERALGVQWCIQSDCFKFCCHQKQTPNKKRNSVHAD